MIETFAGTKYAVVGGDTVVKSSRGRLVACCVAATASFSITDSVTARSGQVVYAVVAAPVTGTFVRLDVPLSKGLAVAVDAGAITVVYT